VEADDAVPRGFAGNVLQAAQGTDEVSADINGVTAASTTVRGAAAQVRVAAGALAKQSDTLKREVTIFLATVRAA